MKILDEIRKLGVRIQAGEPANLGQQLASGETVIQIGNVSGGTVNLRTATALASSETAALVGRQLPAGQRKQMLIVRQALSSLFNEAELRDLVFDLGLDYENFPGASKNDRARELVTYCLRRALLPELIDAILQRRPAAADVLDRAAAEIRVESQSGLPEKDRNIR